jgi:hypothetical protein
VVGNSARCQSSFDSRMGLIEGRRVLEICAHNPGIEVHHSVINRINSSTEVLRSLPHCLRRVREIRGYIIYS